MKNLSKTFIERKEGLMDCAFIANRAWLLLGANNMSKTDAPELKALKGGGIRITIIFFPKIDADDLTLEIKFSMAMEQSVNVAEKQSESSLLLNIQIAMERNIEKNTKELRCIKN